MTKTAIVTGGTRGIGLAIARRFYKNGYQLLIVGKEKPQHSDILSGPYYCQADIGDIDQNKRITESVLDTGWEGLDVLVNNAGIATAKPFEQTGWSDFEDMLRVNCIGPFFLAKKLVPLLKERKGCIINISSISGLMGFSTMAAYCASKFALNGWSQVAAKELAKYGIRVNNVCPGPTQTDMWTALDKQYRQINGWETDEQSEQAYMSKLLIKRMGHTEDIADAVEFLVSDKAQYITGINLKVCGGNLIG